MGVVSNKQPHTLDFIHIVAQMKHSYALAYLIVAYVELYVYWCFTRGTSSAEGCPPPTLGNRGGGSRGEGCG